MLMRNEENSPSKQRFSVSCHYSYREQYCNWDEGDWIEESLKAEVFMKNEFAFDYWLSIYPNILVIHNEMLNY